MSKARGTVVKRGAKWSVVLDLGTGPDGKRVRRWHSGYESADEAERARTELLGTLDGGTYIEPNRLTVRQFATGEWLPSLDALVAGGKIKATTASSYRIQLETYLLPELGSTLLKDLTAPRLNALYGRLLASGRRNGKGLSRTSVRLVHVTGHRMLRDAVKWGRVTRNVADLADPPTPARVEMNVWSPAQLRTFLTSVRPDRLYPLWLLFATTGLRRGEAVGLRWSEVDLEAGRLTVSRASVVVEHKVIDSTPKSEQSARTIGLDPATVVTLRQHRRRQLEERLAWGPEYVTSELVFTWENGAPLHPNVVMRTFQRRAKASGLPVIRLHDLRHTYATAALEAGVPLKTVSTRLGHASIAITGDIYSHVRVEVDQAAADLVAGLILGGE
jgi:integrase